MPWTYHQRSGELLYDGHHVAIGYSGNGEGRNNPAMESIKRVGPVPRGWYTVTGPPFHGGQMGPCCLGLDPDPGNDMHGRSGFAIHGDNATGDASHGCIILGRATRSAIWASGDLRLLVVSGEEPQKESST